MPSTEEMTEKILYWLSLDPQARELAVPLLGRFRGVIGDLPASADHHHAKPGGLYQHSLEVALRMLEEFEGHIIMERKPDGSVDSFQSARNRPKWQFASFVAALCHDLGKVFDMEVRCDQARWYPLGETYESFRRRHRKPVVVSWREGRTRGAHGVMSSVLLHHLLTDQDLEYLAPERLVQIVESLAEIHRRTEVSPISRVLSKVDQQSAVQAHTTMAQEPESKIGQFLRVLRELIKNSELGVNFVGGQVYVMGDRTAVVVPLVINAVRERLAQQKIALPQNTHLYDMLRQARLVNADDAGHCVRRILVPGKQGKRFALSALIFQTSQVVPREVLLTLPPAHFEIEAEQQPQMDTGEQEVG